MSGASKEDATAQKAAAKDTKNTKNTKDSKDTKNTKDTTTQAPATQKNAFQLEEDDEFEDFEVEDWPKEEEVGSSGAGTAHMWEESWDDDDTSDEFSAQLKAELTRMGKEFAPKGQKSKPAGDAEELLDFSDDLVDEGH